MATRSADSGIPAIASPAITRAARSGVACGQVGVHAQVAAQPADQRLGRAAAPVQLGEVDDRSVDVALEAHRVEHPLVERPERDHGVRIGQV